MAIVEAVASGPMSKLRILWLSHFVPYPPKGGCFQRSYNLIRRIGAAHDVHLVALRHKTGTHPEAETRNARDELLRHCRTVDILDISESTSSLGLVRRAAAGVAAAEPLNVSVYRDRAVTATLRERTASLAFDVAHFDTIGLAQYTDAVGDVPRVMTHHGAEAWMIRRRIRREPNLLKKGFFVYEWLTLRRYERRMCARFAVNVVMSDDDGRIMREVAPDATFATVANGVDTDFFRPVDLTSARRLVFAGRLDQYANRDGLLHFMSESWPRVRASFPDASIDIIGMNPPDALTRLAAEDPQVRVHGFVPDVRPFFQGAIAAVCPLRDGGGTRIKVLDALAQGMPIVATTVGCEGIAVVPERDVLIGDTPEAFASQIGRIFEDAPLRARLASSARQLAESCYSWDALASELVVQYRRAIGPPSAAARPA